MSQTNILFLDAKSLYFADASDVLTVSSTDLRTSMAVDVTSDGESLAAFSVDPYFGIAAIPIGEILRCSDRRNLAEGAEVTVSVMQGATSISHKARCLFCRHFGREAADLFANWLSCGPANRCTYPEAAETLPFMADPEASSQTAMITLRFAGGTTATRTFARLQSKTGDGLDVSYNAVRSFAQAQGFDSEIIGYSLWITYINSQGMETIGKAVDYLIQRDRLERITYKFVNPKGAWEYIHASGDLARSVESETGTFVTSGVETEMTNDFTEIMEQNSGHISGAEETEFWMGFLASKERYVRSADGTERLIVVEDSKPSVTNLKVGELTFRWHYGNKNNTVINKVTIPLEDIEIVGESTVDNDRNRLQLGVSYTPAATTQRGVVWQLIDGGEYASLSASGLLAVKDGAQGNTVTVKAVSSQNDGIQATKVLQVTYHDVPDDQDPDTPTGSVDWFIVETYTEAGATKRRLKLNPKYQGMYAEGWVSAGGLSEEGGGGGSGDNTQFVFSQSSTDPGDPSDGDSTSWTASADVSWITLAKSSGSGSDTLSYTVAENTTTASRTGRITITYSGGTETLTVTQAGVAAADGSISPTTVSQVSASGTSLTFTVTDADSVGWTLTSNASWLTLSKTSGAGGSTVTATVAANTSSSARNASLTFTSGGTTTTIAVSQKAAEASASISYPDEITSSAQAVRMTITDTANHGWLLAWFDASSSMITDGEVVSGNASKSGKSISGTGNAVVTLTVSAYDGRWVGDNNEIYLADNETSDMTVVRFYQG